MAVLLLAIADTWGINREVRSAMRAGQVTISGSKFSFTHLIRIVIPKGRSAGAGSQADDSRGSL